MLRTSSPCYRCTTAVAKFAAVTAIFPLFSEICDRDRFEGDFPENGNFNCFGLGLSPRNVTKQWEFQNCRCFATMLFLWKYWRSHSFTHMKFFVRYKDAQLFCRCVLREYHGLFLHRSAAFFVLRLLRSFVERFYLQKKHDCKTRSVSIYHLKR